MHSRQELTANNVANATPRVAYVVSRFPSVTETFVLNEMIQLVRLGLDVEVYAFIKDLSLLRHPGVEQFIDDTHAVSLLSRACLYAQVYWLARKPVRYLKLWFHALKFNAGSPKFLSRAVVVVPKAAAFARTMKSRDIDHVHAHFGTHSALAAYAVRALADIDYSVTLHAHDLYVDRSMLEQKLKTASFVVTISEFNREMLRDLYGDALADKTKVIRCGVDVDRFKPAREQDSLAKIRIVCVASLQPYKGHRYLIEACAELVARGLEFSCLLVGDGELREMLQADIERRKLEDVVRLAGAQGSDAVRTALLEADIFVLPSIVTESGKMEGIPVALMEAMALSLPVVTTRISGIPELVVDGEGGRLVPPANAPALADALHDLARDQDERHRLASNGRARVLAEFDLKSNALKLYRELAAKLGITPEQSHACRGGIDNDRENVNVRQT